MNQHPLHLQNIHFFKQGWELGHNHQFLELMECVLVIVKWQKKDNCLVMVTQMTSGDEILCPVRKGAVLIKRIYNYHGTDINALFQVD